jgi:tetratricopeptide (TPR) repeat protein
VARKYYLYLIPVIIGCLAKPTAVMFAPMLVVYYILFEQKKSLFDVEKFNWVKLMLMAIPCFVVGGVVYLFISHQEKGLFEAGGYSAFNYRITQPFIFVHYVSQFFLPTKLSADTDWGTFQSLTEPKAIIGFLFLACTVFSIFYLSTIEKWRPVSFGLSWFLLALIPTSWVALSEVMNDHRIFYPFVGLSLAVVWTAYLLLEPFLKKMPTIAITAFLILILCGYARGTYMRNEVWRSEESLWRDVSIKSPNNGRGLMNYGLVFMGKGSNDTANYYFTHALEYCPRYSLLHVNMAILKSALGDKVDAEQYFKNGILYGGGEAGNYFFYARFLRDNGRNDEAIANLLTCLKLVDARMDARYMLMPLLYQQKRLEELKAVASRTLELAPNDPTALTYLKMGTTGKSQLQIAEEASVNYTKPEEFLNLSLMYYNAGDYQGCINAAKKAIAIKPDYPEAYNNICSAYNAMNNFEEGVKACEAALKINPGYALAQGNLNFAKSKLKK